MSTQNGRQMGRGIRAAVIIAVSGAMGASVLAGPVVSWGGNYVTQTQDLQGGGLSQVHISPVDVDGDGPDDSRMGRLFSTTTPFNPTANYGGLGGLSSTFYGGAMADCQDDLDLDSWNRMEVENQGPNDQISFQITQGNHQHRIHLSLFWDQHDFLTGNAPITFNNDAVDGMSLSVSNADESMNDAVGRWLIRQGGTFYLSLASFTPENGDYNITGTQLNSTTWAVWDPLSTSPAGSDMDFDGKSPSFTSLMLSEVTAVGFFIEHDGFHDAFNFSIDGFSVTGQPIPEPGTWAAGLAAGLALAGVGYRRARSRRMEAAGSR